MLACCIFQVIIIIISIIFLPKTLSLVIAVPIVLTRHYSQTFRDGVKDRYQRSDAFKCLSGDEKQCDC